MKNKALVPKAIGTIKNSNLIRKNMLLGLGLILTASSFAGNLNDGINPLKSSTTGLRDWVSKNVSYPEPALEKRQEGTVYVSFKVSDHGEVQQIELAKGTVSSLDSAALEIVAQMPMDLLLKASEKYEENYIIPIRFDIR